QTPRQRVEAKQGRVKISLSRDSAPLEPLGTQVTDELASFVAPTAFIQSDDPEIVAAAKQAVGDAKDVFTATSRLTEFVYSAIRDEYVPAYSNAKEALESGRGDCTEHAILFVALARALGIPAKVAVGVAYWPPGGGFGWHAWAEVNAGGEWFAVDPTWNQPIADATHLKLAGGGPAEQARIVMMLGQLEIEEMTGG
ncbi:MAG: transglutaminase-like domain-containing protein, partial [Myxococcota bacterium]